MTLKAYKFWKLRKRSLEIKFNRALKYPGGIVQKTYSYAVKAGNEEWNKKINQDIPTIKKEAEEELMLSLKEDIKKALKTELAFKTKKASENKLRSELDLKIKEQIALEEDHKLRVKGGILLGNPDEKTETINPSFKEVKRDLLLVPIEEGRVITFQSINFQPNTATPKQSAYAELDRIVSFLKDNPGIQIEIGAHTNDWVSYSLAIQLSKNRALAIKKYLFEQGISNARIQTKGYGKSHPIADNNTLEGRRKNQRIEILILKTQ